MSLQAIPQHSWGQVSLSTCQLEFKNYLAEHPYWEHQQGWKSMLNNMQLLLLPLLAFNLVKPWLTVFTNPLLVDGFNTLISLVDLCASTLTKPRITGVYPFSSA